MRDSQDFFVDEYIESCLSDESFSLNGNESLDP